MSPAGRFAFANILSVLDALPVGVLMTSPEGQVLHMNTALAALTGFKAEEARGLPCRHVLRCKACVSGCPLGCGAFPAARGAGRGGVPERNMPQQGGGSFESDVLTLKKRKVPVRLTHFPVPDEQGRELFRLDVVEDLTELTMLEQRLSQASGHGRLIGRSAAMERIASLIPSIAPTGAPVLITGETGTGKDILAETLHKASHRSREPFIRLNISPLPEELLAQEIFGFAPAEGPGRPGRFQQASRGTLYISELADIPPGIQARLVQYLDSGSIVPVGAVRETMPDVRLITATNRDPVELMRQGALSGELFHRLNVAHLILPPLRERKEDIDFLLKHFLDVYAARFKKNLSAFSGAARRLLSEYEYPGNVRELKNIVEYAAMVCPAGEIDVESLPVHLARADDPAPQPAPRRRKKG